MKRIALILSLLLCGTAQATSLRDWIPVDNLSLTIGYGYVEYGRTDNGTWWQNGFENTRDMTSQSLSVGLSHEVTNKWVVGIEAKRLGQTSIRAKGVPDANYNGYDGCIGHCTGMQSYYTEGSVSGVSVDAMYRVPLGAGFTGLIGGGVFAHWPKAWASNGISPGWVYQYREGMQIGPQVQAGVQYDKTQVLLTYYSVPAPSGDINSPVNWSRQIVEIKVRFLLPILE